MKQIVLITGANGMLAKYLTKHLAKDYSLRFLTRNITQNNHYKWDLRNKYIDTKAFKDVKYIIHLAGSPISTKRWSKKRKQSILSSRVDSAQLILNELKKHKISISAFISASAIGYYGTKNTEIILNEESPKGNDFLSDVCSKWEDAAYKFKYSSVANRVSVVRIGIILAKNQGALKRIIQPIKYKIGSGIGTGNQYIPWIHIHDLCGIIKWTAGR